MSLNIIDGMALIKHTGIRGEKFLIFSLIVMTAGQGLRKVIFLTMTRYLIMPTVKVIN
jgi:hypothetical protein